LESRICLIMKMFVVLALAAVAAAEPKADPQVFLSGAYSSPLVRSLTPVSYTKPVSGYAYSSYNPYATYNPYYHPIVKRDADAEAEADPALVYHAGVTGYPVNTYSALSSMVSPVTYTGVPTVYSGLHSAAVAPVAYKAVAPVAPVAYKAVTPVTHKITSYNNPSHYTAESYGAFGPKYIAKNHGVEHVVKREAEAEPEADPALVYHAGVTGYQTHPVNTYSTLNTVVSPFTYTTGSSVVAPVSYSHAVSPLTYGVASPLTGSYYY